MRFEKRFSISLGVSICLDFSWFFLIFLDLSRFVSICLDLSRFVSICLDLSRFVSICLHLSRFVSICLDLSRFVSICLDLSQLCLNLSRWRLSISTLSKSKSQQSRKSQHFQNLCRDGQDILIEIEISWCSLDINVQSKKYRSRLVSTVEAPKINFQ